MNHVLLCGDLHLGHGDGVTQFRPWARDGDHHDRAIVSGINAVTKPRDTLIVAGDAIVKATGIDYFNQLLPRTKVVVLGNHDGERADVRGLEARIVGSLTLYIGKFKCVVTHIPIHPSEFKRWDVNIHAHTHDYVLDDPRYVCVSLEQINYQPVRKDWILQRLLERNVQCQR